MSAITQTPDPVFSLYRAGEALKYLAENLPNQYENIEGLAYILESLGGDVKSAAEKLDGVIPPNKAENAQ